MQPIQGQGLFFYPLYWIHNDCWQTYLTGFNLTTVHNHWGHTHLFLMGFDWSNPSGDAFSGLQNFKFEIQDIWGPRSADANQMTPYQVIGTPQWYFNVQEIWRRFYIQQWDEDVKITAGNIVGRRGVKWDASDSNKTFGPFREGNNYAPLFINAGARTLPVEYYTDESRIQANRDNYIRDKMIAAHPGIDPTSWIPPSSNYVKEQTVLDDGDPAGLLTFPDLLYIHPIIEYMSVTQLDWERPPGFASEHDIDANNFGDGWQQTLTVPFVDPTTNKYRSPFCSTPGVVLPPGQYNELSFERNGSVVKLVPDSLRPAYRAADYTAPILPTSDSSGSPGGYDYVNQPFGLPQDWSLQKPITFWDPYNAGDGRWVQQCLGGIVQARALVTIQHRAYGVESRQQVWITATQYIPTTSFSGTDQAGSPS